MRKLIITIIGLVFIIIIFISYKLDLNNKNKEKEINTTVSKNIESPAQKKDEEMINIDEETTNIIVQFREDLWKSEDYRNKIIKEVESKTQGKVKNVYDTVLNGFSIDVKRNCIDIIKGIEGVESVTESKKNYPQTSETN